MVSEHWFRKGVHPSRSTIPIEDEDPDAEHKMYIKYASDTYSDSDDDTPINLHGVDTKATRVGLVLWGDLKVLIDSPEVNDGSDVWKNQNTWIIQSWKLYSSTGIHVLETVSGIVLHMFVDKRYPLSVNLIERMLEHQLEIFPAGSVVPTGKDSSIVSTGSTIVFLLVEQYYSCSHPLLHRHKLITPQISCSSCIFSFGFVDRSRIAKLSSRGSMSAASMPQTLSCICHELDICDVRTSYVSRRQCTISDGDDVAPCLLRGLATPALLVLASWGD
ncbi:hypothetical protein Tco_1022760 [Tanacetum coccineum]